MPKLAAEEKERLDAAILKVLAEYPAGHWLLADTIASSVRHELDLPVFGSIANTTDVAYRLRELRRKGKVRNRPAESPYSAGNYEWRSA